MKELTVLSGKGGTGKTSVTAALASLAGDIVLCDNDVDAANLHLLAQPIVLEEHVFLGGWQARIDELLCTGCGLCAQSCHFNAIHPSPSGKLSVNIYQCEGCRLCERLCPFTAITSHQSENNRWYVSDTRWGKMVHARMGPGEENSGKLVTKIRNRARELAFASNAKWIINDGPPGIGCATISSLSGVDMVLIVSEPSLSGLHDAKRLVELAQQFKMPIVAVINKFDIHTGMSEHLTAFFVEKSIPIAGRLPFDELMVEAMVNGKTIIEYAPVSEISQRLKDVWKVIDAQMVVA